MYSEDQIKVAMQKAKKAGWSQEQITQARADLQAAGLVQKKGFLRGVAESIVQPAVDYGALVGEAGAQAIKGVRGKVDIVSMNRLLESQRNIMQDKSLSQQEKERKLDAIGNQISAIQRGTAERAGPTFMTSPKREYAFQQMTEGSLPERLGAGAGYGLRKGVGAASYFIPAGGAGTTAGARIASAAGRGALVGGARTFGEDYTGVEDVAMGALGGGVFGAGAQSLGEAYRGIRGALPKAGRAIEAGGKKTALKGMKVSNSQARKWAEKHGGNIEDYLADKGYSDIGYDDLDEIIGPLQQQFDDVTVNSKQRISKEQVLKAFDDKIRELSSGGKSLDDSQKAIVAHLKTVRGNVKGRPEKTFTLGFLTETRRSIDANTPSRYFNPFESGKKSIEGNIYRKIISDKAGTTDLGRELSKLYTLKDMAWTNSFKGTSSPIIPFKGLIAATVGGTVGGFPGAAVGAGLEQAARSPKVIGKLAGAQMGLGRALQGVQPVTSTGTSLAGQLGGQVSGLGRAAISGLPARLGAEAFTQEGGAQMGTLPPVGFPQQGVPQGFVPQGQGYTSGGANYLNTTSRPAVAPNMMLMAQLGGGGFGTGEGAAAPKLSEFERKIVNAKQGFANVVNMIDQGGFKAGLIGSSLQDVGQKIGIQDPEYTAYKQALQMATIQLRNAMLGAQMTPQEMNRFQMPTERDPLPVARQKLITLIQQISSLGY